MTGDSAQPCKLVICYAKQDKKWGDQLKKYLVMLERNKLVSIWDDLKISPGRDWKQERAAHLKNADIVLLLISQDFIGNNDCYGEMQMALEKSMSKNTLVIPILVKHSVLENTPLHELEILPRDKKPISSYSNPGEVLSDIAREISLLVAAYDKTKQGMRHEKEEELRAMIAIPSSFMQARLESFVGRHLELADIRQHIADTQHNGGYITITGQAGQGKSSIIAKLVEEYEQKDGREKGLHP